MTDIIWIGHTVRYRGGSAEFGIAARTMQRELVAQNPDCVVRVAPLDGKEDFTAEMSRIAEGGNHLRELHFIGHAGMYGPMFRTTAWPEQFSPHEWRSMSLPFGINARAYFHTCRSARWFAPFFARTFGVPTWGHQGYTTVSAHPNRFVWAGPSPENRAALYLIETVGHKTHGLTGSIRKYLGAPAIAMPMSLPAAPLGDRTYDKVADLYHRAYADIRVREFEWRWLRTHLASIRAELGRNLHILDIGCGNGALLSAIDQLGVVDSAVGVDISAPMLAHARATAERPGITFTHIDSPSLPLPDRSVDIALSFLSFRYLDWDPVMAEIRRVLAPGGRLIVVDMVERRATLADLPRLGSAAVAHWRAPRRRPEFTHNLRALTSHADWQEMLRHNPIRAEHEYRWYLESRFPGAHLETLSVAPHNRVVAFDSGPLVPSAHVPMSYP